MALLLFAVHPAQLLIVFLYSFNNYNNDYLIVTSTNVLGKRIKLADIIIWDENVMANEKEVETVVEH